MSQEGFELMIPMFGRAKTFHALDRAATAIGWVTDSCLLMTEHGLLVTEYLFLDDE
jgi:hypothetical protein